MPNFKEIFFSKYASMGRQKAIKEFQEQYEPKKGGRFNLGGITYEISSVQVKPSGLEFEISSKIPVEQLNDKMSREDFFEAVKEKATISDKGPHYIGMEDIVHKIGDREIKKRDYIRLRYFYEYRELYNEEEILSEIQAGRDMSDIPAIPGVQSPAGRLTLLHLNENLYNEIKKTAQALLDANEEVRGRLSA